MRNKTYIDVLIVTKNRPLQLARCVRSILANTWQNFHIFVLDQSDTQDTSVAIRAIRSSKIIYKHVSWRGKSKGLNMLLQISTAPLLAFTDDDCVVQSDWLAQYVNLYKRYPKADGAFGLVEAHEPSKHKGFYCPALFETHGEQIHSHQSLDYYKLGIGNNMSFRKKVITRIGGFRSWLGVGTWSMGGEESDVTYRVLQRGGVIVTSSRIKVCHDKWLTYDQERIRQMHYTSGFIAFLSYYLLSRERSHASYFIKVRIQERVRIALRELVSGYHNLAKEVAYCAGEMGAALWGLVIGLSICVYERGVAVRKETV